MFPSPSIAFDRLRFQNHGMTNLRINIVLEDDHQTHEVYQIQEVHQAVWQNSENNAR